MNVLSRLNNRGRTTSKPAATSMADPWWQAALRYCVMEAQHRLAGGVEPYVVVDLPQQAAESRHDTAESARRRADELIAAEAARLADGCEAEMEAER